MLVSRRSQKARNSGSYTAKHRIPARIPGPPERRSAEMPPIRRIASAPRLHAGHAHSMLQSSAHSTRGDRWNTAFGATYPRLYRKVSRLAVLAGENVE